MMADFRPVTGMRLDVAIKIFISGETALWGARRRKKETFKFKGLDIKPYRMSNKSNIKNLS